MNVRISDSIILGRIIYTLREFEFEANRPKKGRVVVGSGEFLKCEMTCRMYCSFIKNGVSETLKPINSLGQGWGQEHSLQIERSSPVPRRT